MEFDSQTFAVKPDGTFTIKLDGKDTTLVKESDLLTVKGSSETARADYEKAVAKHQTDLAEANRVKDETHNLLNQERAAKEQLEKDAQESATHKTRVGELETENAGIKDARSKLEEELTGMKRSNLVTIFKVDESKVKDMTLDQLRTTESSLQLVVAPGKPANYDGGSGGAGGVSTPLTVIEQSKQELKVAREIQAKKRAGTFDPDYKP